MKQIARLNFAHLPTPIEELPRLTGVLGGPRILVKRDDQTGLAFGGNKTRKLEFLVAEAREQGAKTLISAGAIQSNHCRQTAAAAARFGFDCTLVLTGERPSQPSANFLLDQLFGAEIITVADREDRDRILQETFDNAVASGRKPYLVPYGGSSPTGALGYAFAVEEFIKQNVHADWIVFGTSSGGTHAGLVLGQRLFNIKGKVLGISIDEPEAQLKAHVSELATLASEKLGQRIQFTGDDVFAGTINMDGPIMMEVNRPQDGSVLSQIVRLMEKAQQSQAKYVRLSDRVARLYTPVVHIMALVTFLGWVSLTSVAWDTAMMHALAVLIITCPCALGLAVPVVQVLATSTLMKKGILVKSGDAFERLSSADTIVFDKTGTLTYGTPSLINAALIPDDQWPYIASLAGCSRHPLSRAITATYKGQVAEIQDIKDIPGQGMSGFSNGIQIKIGKKSFVIKDSEPDLDTHLSVYVQVGDHGPIRLLFSDGVREDARVTIENLSKKGYEIYILSGDREGPVNEIAGRLSINMNHVRSSVTPPEKELFLQDLIKAGRKPIMVGDGLNDAPCLLAATASISPSTAIDMAQNAADLVFTSDKLSSVQIALDTARFSQKLVRQNLGMALLYNIIAIPIAMAGYVTPLIAAIAMSLSSLVVVANAFRLTVKKDT